MKYTILLIVFCVLNINAFAQKKPKIKGNKKVEVVNYIIPLGFNAIEVDDALEIKIHQAEESSYTLNADLNLHEIIQFAVHDSVLKIYTTHNITSKRKFEVWLNYTNIESIILKNNSRIESENTLDSNSFKITAHHSSKFDLDVKAEEVEVTLYNNSGGKISSRSNKTEIIMSDRSDLEASISTNETTLTLTDSARLKLSGDSDNSSCVIKNSAEIDAIKIKNSSVKLLASDNSRVYIYASSSLSLYAKENTIVYLYGEPEINIEGFKGKAQLIKK